MRLAHRKPELRRFVVVLAALSLVLLAGCSLVGRLQEELYPTTTPTLAETELPQATATPQAPLEPSAAPPATSTVAPPAPTDTPVPQPTAAPTSAPSPTAGKYLVYARGSSIYRGDYFGADPAEVAVAPQMESSDFYEGLLAIAQGRNVDILDLRQGTLNSFQVQTTGQVDYAEVRWGSMGKTLLHLALVVDASAETFGRSVELRVISPQDGAELGKIVEPDVSGVTVLRYDEALGRILLVPRGPDPSFAEIEYYDAREGQLVGAFPAKGDGEATVSPDGRYLLTERLGDQGAQLVLYDLSKGRDTPPQTWRHPEGSHSVSHVWSPDGRYVAYLLREGRTFSDESTQGLGLWVLDIASMQAKKILEEPATASSLVGWTPDGAYIVGHHRGEAQDEYCYMVRPGGGDRRVLALGPQAEVLGWMPMGQATSVPKVVIDPWRARFLSTVDDPAAMAEVVAQFVAAQDKATDEALSQQVREYLKRAGWQLDLAGPSVKRLARGIAVAQLPPLAIHVLEAGHAQLVASGHLILDARLEGDDLGLIFGVIGASSVQPAYVLLRRQGDATWAPLWTPQGHRDWIATDGEIAFAGKGPSTLQVSGSSFGLDVGEDEVFSECHACPHRKLVAKWLRRGDTYVRQTKLKADAPLADILWEMTEREPYAIVYECLRRLRRDLPVDELVSDKSVPSQFKDLGLLGKDVRLIAEEETTHGVLFSEATSQKRFRATVENRRVMHVERVSD